jgi:hypothetical protein
MARGGTMSKSKTYEEELSGPELGMIQVIRHNRENPAKGKRWGLNVGRLKIRYERRFASNLWGRFGGGWQWKLGLQASRSTIIFNLLVATLTVSWYVRKDAP